MPKIKVLLVDDEKEFVETLSKRLKMRDQQSKIANNGEKALEIMEEEKPDVMVLDLRMPGMDGLDVLKKVKKAYPDVQVIILTGHGTAKDKVEAQRLGAYEYLEKPADIEKLHTSIQNAYQYAQDAMTAAAMAEAGEFETAKKIMDKHHKKQ